MIPDSKSCVPVTGGREPSPREATSAATSAATAAVAPFLLALAVAALLPGCAGGPPRRMPAEIPGYLLPAPPLAGLDTSPLRDRLIVLDPGHGGRFRGAVGPAGLSEADVNLGVALDLRTLLTEAGARVQMTRSADTDLLTDADSTLAGELDRRVALVESLRPDAFVSLHHNSNAARDRSLNETQTYYRLGDDGASFELARAIHRQLALRLGIRPARLLPGNFRVLRQDAAPSVLGEPAMISNPAIEQRLGRPEARRREAEAYFLGLLDYFRGGRPAWKPAQGDTIGFAAGERPEARWLFRSGTVDSLSGSLPDTDLLMTAVTLDGRPQAFDVGADGLTVHWRADAPPSPGRHRLDIVGANLAGRRTPISRTWLAPAPARLVRLTVSVDGAGRAALAWAAPDSHPLPPGAWTWADGARVDAGPAPRGWALLDSLPRGEPTYAPRDAGMPAPAMVTARDDLPGPWRWRALAGAPSGSPRWRLPFPSPPLPSDFAAGAPLVAIRPDRPLWCEWPGLLPLVDPGPDDTSAPRTVQAVDARWPARLLAPGLAGRTVVLDPAGGTDDPDGAGPLGLRGSDLNLAAAREAAALLRGAGAIVHLTRSGETALNAPAKVALANDVDADLFVTVGRAADGAPPAARHHAGSARGAALAGSLARAFAAMPMAHPGLQVSEGSDYLLRQTRCPAVVLELAPIGTEARETVLGDAAWTAAEARAVLLGVAADAARTESGPAADPEAPLASFEPEAALAVIAARPGGLPAAAVTTVVVDGQFPWRRCPALPESSGAAAAASLTSGPGPGLPPGDGNHVLEVRTAGAWQLWLIETGRDGVVARLMAGGARGGGSADEPTARAGG